MATYIYARVSTEEQNVSQQVDYLVGKYEHDYVVSEKFTGTSTERPKFTKLINSLNGGDTLVVKSIDRLGRKSLDIQKLVADLANRNIKVIVSDLDGIDLTSFAGKIVLAVVAQIAEGEREVMLERQAIGIARAKKEGKYKGRKPIATEVFQTAKSLIKSGMSKTDAAKQLKIAPVTLYKYLAKERKKENECS